jgi:hypothetical protein
MAVDSKAEWRGGHDLCGSQASGGRGWMEWKGRRGAESREEEAATNE